MGNLSLQARLERAREQVKKLETQKAQIEARQRAESAKRARADDTRRKILLGALVIKQMELGRLPRAQVDDWLLGLDREDDRKLFGLSPKASDQSGSDNGSCQADSGSPASVT
jgi:large subunit ribosomal protein L7/L12